MDSKARNLEKLQSIIANEGPIKYSDIKKKLAKSDPTLSGYLKILIKREWIESFEKEDRREKWYIINPKKKKEIEGELLKFDAIRFINEISNPVYVSKKEHGKAISVFMDVPDGPLRNLAKKSIEVMIAPYAKFVSAPKGARKTAVVIMVG